MRKGVHAAILSAALVAGCMSTPPAPIGVSEISERPAERALLSAMRAYDEADFGATERRADEALDLGLQSPRDVAMAHKLRAFVYCTSNRIPACVAEFRAARAADPAFALTRAESGHPIWGPAYERSRQ
ncbi:MAG TPA: TssQ family T6SS-associated lipoprotein [Burkholderiaceae bacterium]|jgi:Tfp pilus assembly protein PilF|nr:TssQ family T6SS-associated lipoprotein [Burkholderiaceae bacterium]